jgi:hypothetical protein
MIIPRAWIPKPRIDFGAMQISDAIEASKGDKLPNLAGIFYKQSRRTRSRNGFKGANTRAVMKFSAGLTF